MASFEVFAANLALFAEGTIAGVHIGSAMMEHAAARLSVGHWLAYNHAKGRIYGPVMPVYFALTLIIALVVPFIAHYGPLQWLAVGCLFMSGVITKAINLPLNALFETWTEDAHPIGWADDRRRWRQWTDVRTILTVAAFAFTLAWFSAGR